jgi:hypothetical protein
MQHIRAPGPFPGRRAPVICSGPLFRPLLVDTEPPPLEVKLGHFYVHVYVHTVHIG